MTFEYELTKRIEKHLEGWADWSNMTEDEQEETFTEIYDLIMWAILNSPETPKQKDG